MSTNEVEMMKSIRLLLVEDNAADARVVERHLKDAGLNDVNSDWVQTAAEAAERLQKVEYDLVLLDLGLPDASGLQALRALRAVADLTPIIVLTGSDDYKQGLTAVREGAQDYLEKRRVNAGMLSRIVSYSVERSTFHRDLVRATRRYQDLFNNVPVALFTANQDGVLKTANAACVKMLACAGIPLAKVNFLDLLFEPGRRAQFLDIMAKQRMVEGWETSIHDCKGKQLHVLVNTAPLYDSTQAFAGWEGCITDISMLKQTLEERDRLEDNLRQAQKLEAIGQLAAGIAHEINTPTQYVGDNLRFLKESFGELDSMLGQLVKVGGAPAGKLLADADFDYLKEEIPRALNQSLEGVDRVAKIVRAMKEFSHPAREKTATDLNRAIQSTITVASNEWKYVAEVEMDLDASLPQVHCSPAEFNQVVLNIVVNAAHAIGDVVGDGGKGKGKIGVKTRPDGEWAIVEISDTGCGMPPHVQQRIFDPFFTTKEVGKGTGQGLAIAHNVIVDKHGGTIKVVSSPGKGTTFIIRLPIGGMKSESEVAESAA
ncbi:MAG TPA: ATP-binding protein [Steroidobacteraceae bacterium]|nr:ATP-binding protein [Steroidobacteraceae bacterium]